MPSEIRGSHRQRIGGFYRMVIRHRQPERRMEQINASPVEIQPILYKMLAIRAIRNGEVHVFGAVLPHLDLSIKRLRNKILHACIRAQMPGCLKPFLDYAHELECFSVGELNDGLSIIVNAYWNTGAPKPVIAGFTKWFMALGASVTSTERDRGPYKRLTALEYAARQGYVTGFEGFMEAGEIEALTAEAKENLMHLASGAYRSADIMAAIEAVPVTI
jgi:hypothetical protein